MDFACFPHPAPQPGNSPETVSCHRAYLVSFPSLQDYIFSLTNVVVKTVVLFIFFGYFRWEDESGSCYSFMAGSVIFLFSNPQMCDWNKPSLSLRLALLSYDSVV